MNSDTFMEQSLASHFPRPKFKIKPLISISPLHQNLNEEKLKKKLALHSTTGKDLLFISHKKSISFPHSIKNSIKPLRSQHHLSKLHYRGTNSPYFNNFFFSNLKHLSALSSLKLVPGGGFDDTLKPLTPLFDNLPSCKRLTHLDLEFFRFRISDRKMLRLLLHRIQALKPTLKSLSFRMIFSKYIDDRHLRIFSSYIGKFTQLEALKLNFQYSAVFNTKELLGLATALSKLKSLRKLDLSFGDCSVGKAISFFFIALQQLQNLSDLSLNVSQCGPLEEANLTTESISAGLMVIKTLPIQNLTLNLSTLYYSSEDLSLSRILPQFTCLKSLCLYFTKNESPKPFVDQDFPSLLACLKEIPNLSSLTLSFYNLTQLGAVVGNVGKTFQFLTSLTQLKLSLTALSCPDEDMMSLCSGLEGLTSLKSFDLSLDWIKQTTMKGINALTETLKKMVQVRDLTLNLNGNKFMTNQGFSDLCSSIKCLRNLVRLNLDVNSSTLSLSDKNAEEFAETLKNLDCLESVKLFFLEYSGVGCRKDIFQTLFEVLQKKKTIQDVNLTLGGLNFDGIYPPELLKFKQRRNLYLL